jgi:hypothetical protein
VCKKCIKIRDRNERFACRNAEGNSEHKRNTKTGNTSKPKQKKETPGKKIVQYSYNGYNINQFTKKKIGLLEN